MIAAIAIVIIAALLAHAYRLVVERSHRIGVGVIAREMGGRIYFLDTQILDPAYFKPGAQDDQMRDLYGFGDWLLPAELLRRHMAAGIGLNAPHAHVKLTGRL